MDDDSEKTARQERANRPLAQVIMEAREACPRLIVTKVTWDPYTGWIVKFAS